MGRNALLRHRDTIETRLFQHAADLFDLQPTVTLYDLTSTCFEGAADRQPLAWPATSPRAARCRPC